MVRYFKDDLTFLGASDFFAVAFYVEIFFPNKGFSKVVCILYKMIILNAIHVQRKRDDQKKGNLRYLAEKQGQICEEAIVLAIYQFFLEVICFPGIQIVTMFGNVCFVLLVV